MLIHLIGSMRHFDEDLTFMQTIAETIHTNNSIVLHNWVEAVESRKRRNSRPEETLDWEGIVQSNIDSLTKADALIVEGSRFNYSQGYQTAVALSQNKPVLNLYRKDLTEYKEWPDKLFVSGITNPLFHSASYKNEKELRKHVENFLDLLKTKSIEIDIKITVDQNTHQYLDNQAQRLGVNKAAAIKEIIVEKAKTDS